jgi:hypothetical protein
MISWNSSVALYIELSFNGKSRKKSNRFLKTDVFEYVREAILRKAATLQNPYNREARNNHPGFCRNHYN